jgi:preprotein translocase subunit SecE
VGDDVVVILTSMLFGIYLYLVDISLSSFMNWAFKTLGA